MKKQPTKFQHRVYDAVQQIPRGKVVTYGSLAAYVECRSAQAVGGALKCNPYAPNVPCHRVIKSDFTIGGFKGSKTNAFIEQKKKLLKQEGIAFQRTQSKQYRLKHPQMALHHFH